MKQLEIKYRLYHKAVPPKPIKLQIPGWSGEMNSHSDGVKPQPWHCQPFIDGAVYGLELIYPFDAECHVYQKNNVLIFDGDFSEEQKNFPQAQLPPFKSFAGNHFGMTSALDIKVPDGYVIRLEPHPRFYTDETNTVPCCVPGHLQTEWWTKFFFVVFKNPLPGQTIVFKKGEPYGQILVVPKKLDYNIQEMSVHEQMQRHYLDEKTTQYSKNFAKTWHDINGQCFDNKYRLLNSVYSKHGIQGIKYFLEEVAKKVDRKITFRGKFIVKRKNESI